MYALCYVVRPKRNCRFCKLIICSVMVPESESDGHSLLLNLASSKINDQSMSEKMCAKDVAFAFAFSFTRNEKKSHVRHSNFALSFWTGCQYDFILILSCCYFAYQRVLRKIKRYFGDNWMWNLSVTCMNPIVLWCTFAWLLRSSTLWLDILVPFRKNTQKKLN